MTQVLAHKPVTSRCLVAFIEEQVERAKHPIEPRWKLRNIRHGKGQGEFTNALASTHEALRNRGLAGEKSGSDLGGAHAAHHAQGKRELCFR